MEDEYNDLHPENNNPDFEEMSYLDDNDAALYANGENVYLWKVYTI